MDLQTRGGKRSRNRARECLSASLLMLLAGCQAAAPSTQFAQTTDVDSARLGLTTYASEHYRLRTSVTDAERVGPMIERLESTCDRIQSMTGIVARHSTMDVYVFAGREAWQAFTAQRTGASAPIYLQLERGGYTFGKFSCMRDQGEHDTLNVLSHEALHLFIASQFEARPPPFIEEGLAVQCEATGATNASREKRLGLMREAGTAWMPLRKALTLHAGNVVGLSPAEVDGFYAQAWAFTRFLEADSARPALRQGFRRLLSDAASGALSSQDMSQNPALVERYLGDRLESIEPAFFAYLDRIAERNSEH